MTWRLFKAKVLPEQMLAYNQLDHLKQIPIKFKSKYNNFHSNTFENIISEVSVNMLQANTWRDDNVIITSKRNVVLTL